jgi:4-alpha-glucanotransferase
VRSAIYHHLIKAENAADLVQFGIENWQHYEFTDFDRDSQDELIIESDQQNLYIDPQRGGTLFEWDLRRSMHNLLSVVARHEEGYHRTLRNYEQERRRQEAAAAQSIKEQITRDESTQLASPHTTVRTKEPDLDRYLVVDRYRRYSLIDHFLPASTTSQDFAYLHFEEMGNFVELPYNTEVEQDGQGTTVTLTRAGHVRRPGALGPLPVRLSKTLFIPLGEESLVVRYVIENRGQTRLQTRFASEWNINLLGGGGNDQAYYHIEDHKLDNERFDSTGDVPEVRIFHVGNTWIQQDMRFSLSEAATLWRFSIETVTGSEAGFERNHQGSCLTLLWPLLLEAGQSWSVEIQCNGQRS